jgi:carbonic anhydrase
MNKLFYALGCIMMVLFSCSKSTEIKVENAINTSSQTKSKLALIQFELDHAMINGLSSNPQKASLYFPIQINNEQVTKTTASNADVHYGSFPLNSIRNAAENLSITTSTDLEIANETGKNFISIDGKRYILAQIHFHRDGEHAINGTKGDMEAHLVHVSADGSMLISAVILQVGQKISPLKSLFDLSPKKPEVSSDNSNFDLATLVPPVTSGYYSYNNEAAISKDIPSMKWIVYKKSVQISQQEINQYASIYVAENARPIQTNNIDVYESK